MRFNLARDLKISLFRASLPNDEVKSEFDQIIGEQLKKLFDSHVSGFNSSEEVKNLYRAVALVDIVGAFSTAKIAPISMDGAIFVSRLTSAAGWMFGSDPVPKHEMDNMETVYKMFLSQSQLIVETHKQVSSYLKRSEENWEPEITREAREKERNSRWKRMWIEDDALPRESENNCVADAWEDLFNEEYNQEKMIRKRDNDHELIYYFQNGIRVVYTGERTNRIEVDSWHPRWAHLSLAGETIKGIKTEDDEIMLKTESDIIISLSAELDDEGKPYIRAIRRTSN